jgi:hypothetical protein
MRNISFTELAFKVGLKATIITARYAAKKSILIIE